MRVVGRFQFTAPSLDSEVMLPIRAILDKWIDRKFERLNDGVFVIRRSGASASVTMVTEDIEEQTRTTLTILEPVDGGRLQTDVDVLAAGGRIALRCVLSIGSDGGFAPANVSLRAPRFVREIIALQVPWRIGKSGERVFANCFSIDFDDVAELEALMDAPERRLPIVVVSELQGETLAGDLHERLSQDLCGLAHTVRLSREASWQLTRSKGREWSCYNGAIRLFWPFRANNYNSYVHPLWTWDYMMSRADGEVVARDRIRGTIVNHVIEASTFVSDDPAFRDFEAAKVRQAADQARTAATDGGDMQALAHLYAKENDVLRNRVDDLNSEVEILRQNIEALTIALRSTQIIPTGGIITTPPQTVEEAVAAARADLGSKIVIASETDSDILNLNPSAGPPDKILRYLQTLGELADALAEGPLGKSVPIWLRERGVDCSIDSETMKASKEGKRFRLRNINGETVECEYHAKPSENVAPDMCVRIYFATAPSAPFVKVGYIGRHSL